MSKEVAPQNLKVGDRVKLSPSLPAYLVVDVRYAKQGAIGIFGDQPEHEEAARKAVEWYAEAVRMDQYMPRYDERDLLDIYLPVDTSK